MSSTALASRVARLEEQAFQREMNRLRDEYHRITVAQGNLHPLINTVIHRCIDRGLFAPFPAWVYQLHDADITPEQAAYVTGRFKEMVPVLKPWINGKGNL